MKIETHTETTNIIEIDEVLAHLTFHMPPDVLHGEKKGHTHTSIYTRVRQAIYTDGEVIKVEESEPQSINKYYLNGRKYDYPVDTLIKTKMHIKNASYIVIVTYAARILPIGKTGRGWHEIVEDTKIFLNNKIDIKALKEAKKTINIIYNITPIFDIIFPRTNSLEYHKVGNGAYQRKRTPNKPKQN